MLLMLFPLDSSTKDVPCYNRIHGVILKGKFLRIIFCPCFEPVAEPKLRI